MDQARTRVSTMFYVGNISDTTRSKPRPGTFSCEEDEALLELVKAETVIEWPKISKMLGTKTARQCRDRYQNYLDPRLNHNEWSEEEDSLLLSLYSSYGAKWTQISHRIEGRSLNSVHNRWNVLKRRATSTIVSDSCEFETETETEMKGSDVTEDDTEETSVIESIFDKIFLEMISDDLMT